MFFRNSLLETLEVFPACVLFGRGLDGRWKVDKEVEAGPAFYGIHANCVRFIVVAAVLLVFQPEADCLGGGDVGAVPLDFQNNFPVVVWNRNVLGRIADRIDGGNALAAANLAEGSTGYHIQCI